MIVEEGWGKCGTCGESVELRCLDDTLVAGESNSNTIRQILQCARNTDLVVVADRCTQHLVRPISVGSPQSFSSLAEGVGHIVAELVARKHVIGFAGMTKAHVAIVVDFGLLSYPSLLGGDDNHTVAGSATVDGCSGGVFKDSECFDVLGIDHG